ncbi:hypothetical protein C8F01DRAFT_1151173 [Mycena amicta]|nr:hypothetical protein C8F01DRAFT_1151173 [Mycena amicta]
MQVAHGNHHRAYPSGGSMRRNAPYMKLEMPPSPYLRPRNPHRPNANQQFYPQPSRAGQSPPRVPTQVDERPTDWWHNPEKLLSINYGSREQYPYSISFIPTSGPCQYGVAMLNLEHGRGMAQGDQPISRRDSAPDGKICKWWPGYRQESYVLTLVDPRTRRHVTRAQIGAQVTALFKQFVDTRREGDYVDDIHTIYLGLDGAMYEQVRLSEVYTKDGFTFRAQFGLVPHYLSVE